MPVKPSSALHDKLRRFHGKLMSEIGTAVAAPDDHDRGCLVGAPGYVLATPDGPVVFEDPVQQAAWDISTPPHGIGTAAEGDDLDYNPVHWATVIPGLIRGSLSRTRSVLRGHAPTADIELGRSPLRIAIFGDGGYRGLPQRAVFEMIARTHALRPIHAVVHLGDTYRGGSEAEMFRHLVVPMLELRSRLGAPVLASLCGNHDLYAGPDGYLGVLQAFGQPGRYFSIETPDVRIACLDSASPDTGMRLDGALDDEQLAWLRAKQTDGKRLVILTHHVPYSPWEHGGGALLQQLARDDSQLIWYWGHEHRAAAIELPGLIGGCVGNGAFLERWSPPQRGDGVAWHPTTRCVCFRTADSECVPHGFLELTIDGDQISELWHAEGEDYARTLPPPGARSGGR